LTDAPRRSPDADLPEPLNRAVCVYAGSSDGADPAFRAAARELGAAIAQRGQRLVFGGGRRGLMGELADAALDEGGEVIGVIPDFLMSDEIGHRGVSALLIVKSMHERKKTMADLADAFVALPGGLGTLEEIVEVWTWTHLGLQDKPVGLLDVNDFYADFLQFLEAAVRKRLISPESHALLSVADRPEVLLDAIEAFEAPTHRRLVTPPATERA
jgi:uncharacterized protein (TIGR00730 family)